MKALSEVLSEAIDRESEAVRRGLHRTVASCLTDRDFPRLLVFWGDGAAPGNIRAHLLSRIRSLVVEPTDANLRGLIEDLMLLLIVGNSLGITLQERLGVQPDNDEKTAAGVVCPECLGPATLPGDSMPAPAECPWCYERKWPHVSDAHIRSRIDDAVLSPRAARNKAVVAAVRGVGIEPSWPIRETAIAAEVIRRQETEIEALRARLAIYEEHGGMLPSEEHGWAIAEKQVLQLRIALVRLLDRLVVKRLEPRNIGNERLVQIANSVAAACDEFNDRCGRQVQGTPEGSYHQKGEHLANLLHTGSLSALLADPPADPEAKKR